MDVETLFKHTFTYTNQLVNAENFYLALFNESDNTIDFRLFLRTARSSPPLNPRSCLGMG